MNHYFELTDRLNWQQACTVLGISKSTFYRLIAEKKIEACRIGKRGLWVSREECERILKSQKEN